MGPFCGETRRMTRIRPAIMPAIFQIGGPGFKFEEFTDTCCQLKFFFCHT
jgi:hypothetical protein